MLWVQVQRQVLHWLTQYCTHNGVKLLRTLSVYQGSGSVSVRFNWPIPLPWGQKVKKMMTGVRNRHYDVLWRGSRCQQCPRVKEEGSRWSFALTLWPSVGLFFLSATEQPEYHTERQWKNALCHTVVENNRQLHTWVVLFLGVTDVSVTFV